MLDNMTANLGQLNLNFNIQEFYMSANCMGNAHNICTYNVFIILTILALSGIQLLLGTGSGLISAILVYIKLHLY